MPPARPGSVRGIRRIRKGKRKGQWQRYTRTAPPSALRKGAQAAGETIAAPFFLSYLAGRWAWHKTRKRNAPLPAAPAAAKPEPAPASPVPDPAPRMSRPPRTGRPLHDATKGPSIMNHIDAASEAVTQHIGGWEPENASDLDGMLARLPQFFDATSQAFSTMAERLADGYPVHPSVPEILREIGSTIAGMSDFSGEAHAAHRNMHERELERLENPRRNEQFWDVKENQ